jgi:beta-N-acetylhexosaminidase
VAPRAFICGLRGVELAEEEAAFLREAQPWGVILFKRNVGEPDQVRRLCDAAREALQRADAPILIDQEGGRVQRIGAPHFRQYPAGAIYGQLYELDPLVGVEAAHLGARLIGLDLGALGVTVDCIPVLDVPADGVTQAIGNRTLGRTVDSVSTLGSAQIDGLLCGGLLPVMKHAPGHGRAQVDSHLELPRVDAALADLEASDFAPFRLLAGKVPMAMTCHVVFSQIDPDAPATLSSEVIVNVIRRRIGFDGLLMTDDISMKALSGDFRGLASRAIGAGCDIVLHCNGEMAEMAEIAAGVPELSGEPRRRADAALARRPAPEAIDRPALEARFDELLARVPVA